MDLTERLGRKVTVMASMLLGSAFCVGIGFASSVSMATWRLVLGMLGKFLLGMAFNGIHTWSMELYPTNVRGEGMGWLQVNFNHLKIYFSSFSGIQSGLLNRWPNYKAEAQEKMVKT